MPLRIANLISYLQLCCRSGGDVILTVQFCWHWYRRSPKALEAARKEHKEVIEIFVAEQYLFHTQWMALKVNVSMLRDPMVIPSRVFHARTLDVTGLSRMATHTTCLHRSVLRCVMVWHGPQVFLGS
jgi:hypothetical protein